MINRSQLKKRIQEKREFLLYACIGVGGVIIDIAVFLVLFNVVKLEKNLATFISLSVAITNNFMWNSFLNFKVSDNLRRRYFRFYAVGITGFLLTALLFFILTDLLGVNANVTKIVSLPPLLILQYSLNRIWSFKKNEEV